MTPDDMNVPPRVVVVTPVFNEAGALPRYRKVVTETLLDRKDVEFRVLFVDDGSSDNSWEVIEDICSNDRRFSGLRLSRNFGAHVALTAGIQEADGDAVATLACDLQDPPETILEFVDTWKKGARIVWGKRVARQDTAWRTWASKLFFRIMRRHAMPAGSRFTTGSFLLIDRLVADCFRKFREQNRITFALVAWTGFDQEVVGYERQARVEGASGWSFSRMIKTMWDAFIGFSSLPFTIMTWTGVSLFTGSLLFAAYLVLVWATGSPQPGWTSIAVLLSLFFGLQFLMMGMIGQYLSRIYTESVRRPLYFISDRTVTK